MTGKRDIVLIGGGGHARAVIDVIEATDRWRIIGIVDPGLAEGAVVSGYRVLGGDDQLPRLKALGAAAVVTIGQIKSAQPRRRCFNQLQQLGFELPVIASPLAVISRLSRIGAGTTVMHLAMIGPQAVVGHNCIVNSRALIEHDATVGDHCHVSTSAVLNGGASVGEDTFIGSGAILRQGATVGARCVVGMGVRVLASVPDDTLYTRGSTT